MHLPRPGQTRNFTQANLISVKILGLLFLPAGEEYGPTNKLALGRTACGQSYAPGFEGLIEALGAARHCACI